MRRELPPKRGFFASAAIAFALALAAPAAASAADTYADAATGNDGNDCTVLSTPCATIGAALAQSGASDTTFVADGTYSEAVDLDQGKSLAALDPDDPRPFITSGNQNAITVDAGGAGTVSGLHISALGLAIAANGSVTVEDNVFDGAQTSDKSEVMVESSGVTIRNNRFVDPTADGFSIGVFVDGGVTQAPIVMGNTFEGMAISVIAFSDATIVDNQMSGAHPLPGAQLTYGAGIIVSGVSPTIGGNTIGAAAASPSRGIELDASLSGAPTGALISRTSVTGNDIGIDVADTTGTVTINNSVVYANTVGLKTTDTSGEPDTSTQGDVSATNATIYDNDTDVQLDHTTLTLDSSIVGDPIDLAGGAGACDITYSSGSPSTAANGCDDFDFTGNPQFANPGTDYRLSHSSPLIDTGNPAHPGVGVHDFYGDPREVQGKPCSSVRRDIGAAEFVPPATPGCSASVYVDPSAADDSGSCASPASPCKTIGGAIYKVAEGGDLLLAADTYSEQVNLGDGLSLLPTDPNGPRPVIDGGMQTAVTIEPSGAGTVHGLRILSGYRSVEVGGSLTLSGNLINESPASDRPVIQVESGTSGVEIRDNDLIDPDATGYGIGVLIGNSDTPVVTGNRIQGLAVGAASIGGDVVFTGNDVSGMHDGVQGVPGVGYAAISGTPTVEDNVFHDAAASPSAGIDVFKADLMGPPVGLTARRNVIHDLDTGIEVNDADLPVTLEDNLIYGNGTGLLATDSSGEPDTSTQGDVTATNLTIFGNDLDVQLDHTTLTLDSSIVGDPIDLAGGDGACSITYSRGAATDVANGCGSFDTSADPGFADAAGGNFHLLGSSPLIDVGNPASPGSGATDVFGAPREVQGKPCSSVRRDIGAAEHQLSSPPGCPTPTPPAPAAPATPPSDPPAAKIEERPDKRGDDRSPTFDFSSDILGAHFRCRLDSKKWKLCTPPVTYSGVSFGKHRFKVYAVSPDGLRGKTRTFDFRIVRDD